MLKTDLYSAIKSEDSEVLYKSPWKQSRRWGKDGKNLPKSQILRWEWKTERVREGERSDSEDGEGDEKDYDGNVKVFDYLDIFKTILYLELIVNRGAWNVI